MLYHHAIISGAVFAAGLAFTPTASANDSPPPPTDDYHDLIVVTAAGIGEVDVLAGTSVLQGQDLQRNLDGQLGAILESLPGVSATGFAPGASRPVLRGFQGERVRVLVDGIGAIDASNTSADHAVSIDPLTAQRIEVLRGPAALLYGSGAIGGAVNVVSKRIPPAVLDEPFHVDAIASIDTASDLTETGASLDFPIGGSLVVHGDISWRKTDDLEVPGFLVAPGLRAALLEEADEEETEGEIEEAGELREAALARGQVDNSGTETLSFGGGLAWFGDAADFGFAVSHYDTRYGVPGAPGAGHHHGEDEGEIELEEEGEVPVSIDLSQWRGDLRAGFDFAGGPFARLNTRWGYSDYTHTEFEGDEVGTVFDVSGVEGRVELVQRERGAWSGTTGLQFYHRDFKAEGEEAYVPKNRTAQWSLFAVQQLSGDAATLELAGRLERSDIETEAIDRAFTALSGAAGLWHETDGGLRFGANASRVERAPAAEELFAEGPHIATQQFEVGDATLDKEIAWGLEAYLRGKIGQGAFRLTAYRTWFEAFIYLAETGAEEDDLPVFAYRQQGADHMGAEFELSAPLWDSDGVSFAGDLGASWVRATLSDGSPVPRIPPLSARAALEAAAGAWRARGEVEWHDAQDRTAEFETATDGFTMVNASLAWTPWRGERNLTIMLQGENLLDVTGRRHASFTKDFVPMAGRNVRLSARVSL